MKTIFALSFMCVLCVATASAQSAPVLTNNPQALSMPDHPQHASMHALAQESSLIGGSAYSYAQGERPLWEFGSPKQEVPLGDVARAEKRVHAGDRKAVRVWQN